MCPFSDPPSIFQLRVHLRAALIGFYQAPRGSYLEYTELAEVHRLVSALRSRGRSDAASSELCTAAHSCLTGDSVYQSHE